MKTLVEYINESSNTVWGIKGTKYIWNGDWNDPEIEYKGKTYNYYEAEEFIADEVGQLDLWKNDGDAYDEWAKNHQKDIEHAFNEYINSQEG